MSEVSEVPDAAAVPAVPAPSFFQLMRWLLSGAYDGDLDDLQSVMDKRRYQVNCEERTLVLRDEFPEDPSIQCTGYLYEKADYRRAWAVTVVSQGWTIEMSTTGFSDPTEDEYVEIVATKPGTKAELFAKNGRDADFQDDDITEDEDTAGICQLCERILSRLYETH